MVSKMSMGIRHAQWGREAILYGGRPAAGLVNHAVRIVRTSMRNGRNSKKLLHLKMESCTFR